MAQGFGWSVVVGCLAAGVIGFFDWPLRLPLPMAAAAQFLLLAGLAGAWFLTRRDGPSGPDRLLPVAVGTAAVALASEAFAYVALTYMGLPGNSGLWFPVNLTYFGGILLAGGAVLLAIFAGLRGAPRGRLGFVVALAAASVMVFSLVPYR